MIIMIKFTIGITITFPAIWALLRLNQFRSCFGALKNLESEGMSAASVAQKPMFAITTTINAVIAAVPVVGFSTHVHTSRPWSAALPDSEMSIQNEISKMTGAAKSANLSMAFIPRAVLTNWAAANSKKQINQ